MDNPWKRIVTSKFFITVQSFGESLRIRSAAHKFRTKMSDAFFDKPTLNSPYECPPRHWELDEHGQPTQKIIESRRRAIFNGTKSSDAFGNALGFRAAFLSATAALKGDASVIEYFYGEVPKHHERCTVVIGT
jgi:hypothetical protein